VRLSFILIHQEQHSRCTPQQALAGARHRLDNQAGRSFDAEWHLVTTAHDAGHARPTPSPQPDGTRCWGPVRPARLAEAVNAAARAASGDALVLLDNALPPAADQLADAADYLHRRTDCGMIAGQTRTPGGEVDASGLPALPGDGNAMIRQIAFDQVGGLCKGLGRVGRGYDLGLRLWRAGYRVEAFDDFEFERDAAPDDASAREAMLREGLLDRLIVADRYLPGELRTAYCNDWLTRNAALAEHAGCGVAAGEAERAFMWWRWCRAALGRQPLDRSVVDHVLKLDSHREAITAWADRHRVFRVVIVGVPENLFAAYRGCADTGVRVGGLASDYAAFVGTDYRGHTVSSLSDGVRGADGVVIATMHPARVGSQLEAVRKLYHGPVLQLWRPRHLADWASRREQAA